MNEEEATATRRFHQACLIALSLTISSLSACGGGGGKSPPPITDPDVQTVGCLDNAGLDLFAAETTEALGLSWNNQAGFDASGGYRVRYGTTSETYLSEESVNCTALDCEATLVGLNNDTNYYIVVDSLGGGGQATGTSCEITATPHVLTFSNDLAVNPSVSGQFDPTIASGYDGTPLFLAWVENNEVVISRSDDRGVTWSNPGALWGQGTIETAPTLTFRRRIAQTNPDTGELEIIVQPALFATIVVDGVVKFFQGDFPDGPANPVSFSSPIDLGTGDNPTAAAYGDHVEVVYGRGNAVWASSSADGGQSFFTEQRVDKASGNQFSARPHVAIEGNTSDVFVAYHGLRAAGGDTNIYLNHSKDAGITYQETEIRIDDDANGYNQSNVSLATDPRTGHVMATWEDRRGGSNVYFSRSVDGGLTWEANLNSGAGLTGDQFEPRADVDPGRNVFVFFVDTSAGQRPLFNRFNALGSFDIPAEVSSSAGTAGAVAKGPVLTIDKFGRAFVAWGENRGGPVDNIFFARGE